MSAFDEWYNGMVGFEVNSDRILNDLFHSRPDPFDAMLLEKWMKVCWNNAVDAVVDQCDFVGFDPDKLRAKP